MSVSFSLILDFKHNTVPFPVSGPHVVFSPLFVSISINLPPLFDGQQQTKAAENNSNNKHEKKEEKQKEENNMANKVNEVSSIL